MRELGERLGRDDPSTYQIKVQGELGEHWVGRFSDMTITNEAGITILTGTIADQRALHGLLIRIRDWSLPLISVHKCRQPSTCTNTPVHQAGHSHTTGGIEMNATARMNGSTLICGARTYTRRQLIKKAGLVALGLTYTKPLIETVIAPTPVLARMNEPMEGFSDYAEQVRAEWGVPGMAIGVVKDGEVVYMRGFGYRDVKARLPVTTQTLFAIGSTTKAFTALAVGMLVDEGKLDLDTALIEYMPDFRLHDDYATLHATPRDLLCHRTGMPGYDALWMLSNGNRDELLYRLRYLKPTAGFRDDFQYNNLMYMVAGALVGHLGGGSWESFVTERIFRPLGMEHSNFDVIESQEADDFAQPYVTFTGEPVRVPFRRLHATGPAGSVNSNIEDMAKWVLLHLNNGAVGEEQLISQTSLAQTHLPNMVIREPLLAKLAQSSAYGQGWYISDYRGYRHLEHGGNIDGFSSVVSLLPSENIGVVVLSNSLNMMGHVIVRDIYDRLLGLEERDWNAHYRSLFAEIMEMLATSAGAQQEARPNTSPSSSLADFAGAYEHPAFGRVDVAMDNGKLAVTFQSGLTSELEHFHFDVFKGTTSDFYLPQVSVRFHLSNAGTVESLSMPLESGVADIFFRRVETESTAE